MNSSTLESVFARTREPLEIPLDGDTLRVQLCLSPLCTTIASLLELGSDGWWEGPPQGWRRLQERVRGIDMAALEPYTQADRFPRFLTSALKDPAPRFEDQIEEITSATDDQIRADLHETFNGDLPAAYASFTRRPRQALERLGSAMSAYWERIVQPAWPTARGFLEREMLKQGYALATLPPSRALNEIHPSMRVQGDVLSVVGGEEAPSGAIGRRGLMLTPLVSARQGLLVDLGDRSHVKVGYGAPGAEAVWGSVAGVADASDVLEQLAELLGRSRARILVEVGSRATTTGLAETCGLAPATVSEHLGMLARCGLVERARVGRSVYYRLSERGADLIDLFAV